MENFSYGQKKAALIEEITAAFNGVSREDGVTLHEAMALDNYGGPEERQKARAQDIENRWQDVPDEDIRSSDAVLNFLDPKGFRYYIPAFLVWYLTYVDSEDPDFWSNNFDSVDFQLEAGRTGDIDDHYLSKFTFLTHEQSKAIARFLVFLAERENLYHAEEEALRQAEISRGDISRAESDAHWENVKRNQTYHGIPDNQAQHSLNRYWGNSYRPTAVQQGAAPDRLQSARSSLPFGGGCAWSFGCCAWLEAGRNCGLTDDRKQSRIGIG